MTDTTPIRAFLDDSHLEFSTRVDAFSIEEMGALPEPVDDPDSRRQARHLLEVLGRGQWFDPIRRRDWRACCLARESLAAVSPLADSVFALQALGSVPIQLSDNQAMQDRWLSAALSGEAMMAFAMTEPEAGSDVAAMSTSARRDGTEYVLSGQKTLISNAGIADIYTVFAVTDPRGEKNAISCFVVPAETPGLEFRGPQVMSAPHPLGDIAFHDCRVPEAFRLGDEGAGMKLGMATLDRLRPTVGAAACGMAWRALDEALRHAATRRKFGKPLAELQIIQQKLARMATDLVAASLLVYRAACEADQGAERVTLESAMAKSFATEAAQHIVDDAVQIVGGRGVLADHPVDRLYRSVRALRIYEGTTEIQQLVIAGLLLRSIR